MPRLTIRALSLACLLPLSASAFAGSPAQQSGPAPAAKASPKAWKPKWLPMKAPSENTHLIGTQAQRVFFPMAAVRITNHLRDEGHTAKDIIVAGHENNVATIKLYQESTDRYTRLDIPPELLRESNIHGAQVAMTFQGIGTSGKHVIVAGGSQNHNGYGATKKLFMIDGQSKRVTKLPELGTARALPMVGSSPNGRYIVVAGGIEWTGRQGEASKALEVIDRVTGQHVDLATKFPGLASGLPDGRFAGSISWVQQDGVDRIFFIGGAAVYNNQGIPLASEPTKAIHYYDVLTQSWGHMELPTPRMGAAVALRHLGHGEQEIVVAGGGTGTHMARPVDPQIYAVERINPQTLGVKFGENLPEQHGFYTTRSERQNGAIDWAPNAMVLTHGKQAGAGKVTVGARLFGFANAYKTDPVPAEEGGAAHVVNVHNTTIHSTAINQTNIRDDHSVRVGIDVDQTNIQQSQAVHLGR
jgi:hypothetical protein